MAATILENGGVATVIATLSGAVNQAITVSLGVTGTATGSGTDYTATTTTLNFTGGLNETQTVAVPMTAGTIVEPNETFEANLSNVQGTAPLPTISDAQGIGTITNDDSTDLQLSKTNATSGMAVLNVPFSWLLTATNTGASNATLPAGTTILTDTLPPTATYSVHSVTNITNVTNSANIQCNLAGLVLTCTVVGGDVTLGATTGAFTVRLIATPTTAANLVNPTGGVCMIDPNNTFTETNETNNSCQETVVVGTVLNAFGLTLQDQTTGVPFQFVDISGSGTPVAGQISGPASGPDLTETALLAKATATQSTVTLGGSGFNLFGTPVTELAANTSGYLSTDTAGPATDTTNDCPLPMVPSDGAGARLYVLHDDLDTSVRHQYFATCPRPHDVMGFSPKGCNIFQWDGTYVSGGGNVRFQALLYDEVAQIVYQYTTVDQTGASSTTGLQDASSTDGLLYQCNVPDSILANTTAVSFLHPAPVPVELQTFTIE